MKQNYLEHFETFVVSGLTVAVLNTLEKLIPQLPMLINGAISIIIAVLGGTVIHKILTAMSND